ncbi:glycine/D-amino acid oxidase-like deaminating enzyme [Curtobacterium luteum]|uniref:Glycine/D-amino acid oxidase-like deaminating enzyme n=1 Tax=Curtobacterium luteum TaxID=33881 RepID=A0ABS2RYH7_9MICO|nr:FAD-dependent oxidoreductase [Curtobacterium luteum]MBM7803768.1 glycine/D-amino acid oxidase-like deaminating enzyme [Curtobacterium luteum]NUU51508.1 hypothetical protein [Curtobacterium luteum]
MTPLPTTHVVIGGGIVGAATAFALTARGGRARHFRLVKAARSSRQACCTWANSPQHPAHRRSGDRVLLENTLLASIAPSRRP